MNIKTWAYRLALLLCNMMYINVKPVGYAFVLKLILKYIIRWIEESTHAPLEEIED